MVRYDLLGLLKRRDRGNAFSSTCYWSVVLLFFMYIFLFSFYLIYFCGLLHTRSFFCLCFFFLFFNITCFRSCLVKPYIFFALQSALITSYFSFSHSDFFYIVPTSVMPPTKVQSIDGFSAEVSWVPPTGDITGLIDRYELKAYIKDHPEVPPIKATYLANGNFTGKTHFFIFLIIFRYRTWVEACLTPSFYLYSYTSLICDMIPLQSCGCCVKFEYKQNAMICKPHKSI